MIDRKVTKPATTVPAARMEDLVMTESADELLVYDTRSHHIHHLNTVTATIWRLCDGKRSVNDVVADVGVDGDVVRLALTKLSDADLLASPLASAYRVSGQSRRAFLRKAAVAASVPVIVSVTAPSAAMAGTEACGTSCDAGGPGNPGNADCRGFCSQCGAGPGTGSGQTCCHDDNAPGTPFPCP